MVKTAVNIWERLIGPAHAFSSENRTVNAVGVITFCLLLFIYPINFVIQLQGSAFVTLILLSIQAALYYLSRFRKKYRLSMGLYASLSYVALAINYRYNSGITGPTILLFFLSFQFLIAITPKSQHKVWGTLHLTIGLALLLAEYLRPELIQQTYRNRESLFFDVAASYVISLSFIYIITNYLLTRYGKEKKLAKERAAAIEAQNKALKEIAWKQSHEVRSHVATILGLAEVLNVSQDKAHNDKIITDIKEVATDLDGVIREINKLSHEGTRENQLKA